MSAGTLETLFSPITIGTMRLENRAVMPAMATGYSNRDNTVSERLSAYLARRARGGMGLVITEICAVDPRGRNFPAELGIWDDSFIPGLQSLADAIHREGAKAAVQLHHAGRETFKSVIGVMPEAPSAIPSAILGEPCEEMSEARIREMVQAYGEAALRAKKAGFDAVEVHGAHGYLITQFLSPFSNHRNDSYGGSDENRARFALEVVRAVREKAGRDFTVIVRVSSSEEIRGGYDIEFMKWLAPQLVEAGADAIHASVGVYSTPGNLSIACADTEEGFNLGRAREIRQAVNVPVIGVGRIHDPRLADEAIRRGDADLVAFGRQSIADPDFLRKAREGEFDRIRFCMACNQGCIERLSYEMKSVACVLNPECGKEHLGPLEKAKFSQNVWIIGAGPAGISAALAASARGHRVRLFERDREPGGQLRVASAPPHKEGIAHWLEWALREIARQDVVIELGVEVTDEMLDGEKPDTVILAAGAIPVTPPIPGIQSPIVHDAWRVLKGEVRMEGPAVVLGAGYTGMEAADYLIQRGVQVRILEMKPIPPVGLHTAHGYWLHRRLKKSGGALVLGAEVKEIGDQSVTYFAGGKTSVLEPVKMVVTAMGVRPENALERSLTARSIPYTVAGDAKQPRRLLEAIHEGYDAGLSC